MTVTEYYKSRALPVDWTLEGGQERGFAGAVVIPALAECNNLLATLLSLSACPEDYLRKFLVVVVVNNRLDAREEDKADNLKTLELLASLPSDLAGLRLAWVDAATAGAEMPLKGGGVGMARKIGCDLALDRLDFSGCDPILVCLDADTVVRADYLSALDTHFQVSSAGAAVIPFIHQSSTTVEGQQAIDRYELFLRSYVLGLKLAGSPYAFHTVGSAMACRASAYMKIGGMNCRQAGEDFYFLQQLAKVVGVSQLTGTFVYPSARASHRVPFGTGRAVSCSINDEKQTILFYRPECYCILAKLLGLSRNHFDCDGLSLLNQAEMISPHLKDYLAGQDFVHVWQGLQRNNPKPERFVKAFHDWFDGLKTMRLIHHLSAGCYPRCEPEHVLPTLFCQGKIKYEPGVPGQLETLRYLQSAMESEC